MGQITSGVGLISGINIKDVVDQLIAIESRPKSLITSRNTVLTTQSTALQEISAKLLALKTSVNALATSSLFKSTKASSSNETVLTATSSTTSVPGSYQFTVDRLVSTQQLISKGFADTGGTPVGAGTLTFEFGDARLDADTVLSRLNGGDGVNRGKIRITDRAGNSATVDLSKALTVNDVLNAINSTSGINVTASVDGDGLKLVDSSAVINTGLSVADVGLTNTAASLGLNNVAVGDTLTGSAINTLGENTLLNHLNDGNGIRFASGLADLQITDDSGTYSVNLSGATTLGDIAEKIETASGGNVTLGYNGASLTINGTGNVTVAALNSSKAAEDLGILGSGGGGVLSGERIAAALNSKLVKNLAGGSIGALDSITVTNRLGNAYAIDLSGARSFSDVIKSINDNAVGVTASLNNAGNGILLTDTTNATASNLQVAGTSAAALGLDQSVAGKTLNSGNLQLRYISESTLLSSLNGGSGITRGQFTIRDSQGVEATVDLTQGNELTIADVIAEINSRGLQINARVNDNGDGILIEDTGPGTIALRVTEAGSSTAKDLGLLGTAANPGENLNGSFERTVTIESTDTLQAVVDKINNAGIGASATIINDGSGVNPYRLTLNAQTAGRAGAFVFDDGGLGFNTSTLTQARDAVIFYGSADPASAIVLQSTTNNLNTVIPGASISLTGTSDTPVQVSISRDDQAIVDGVKKLVDSFNAIVDTLNKFDKYNSETKERGLLLGDPTVARVRSALFRTINSSNNEVTGQFNNLFQVGVKMGSGAKLQFDETRFRAALATDRDAVVDLFSLKQTETIDGVTTVTASGFATKFDEVLASLTDSSTGIVQGRVDSIRQLIEANTKRLAQMDILLASKRARLEAQFTAMEKVLAQMQGQSSALTSLQNLATATRNNR